MGDVNSCLHLELPSMSLDFRNLEFWRSQLVIEESPSFLTFPMLLNLWLCMTTLVFCIFLRSIRPKAVRRGPLKTFVGLEQHSERVAPFFCNCCVGAGFKTGAGWGTLCISFGISWQMGIKPCHSSIPLQAQKVPSQDQWPRAGAQA